MIGLLLANRLPQVVRLGLKIAAKKGADTLPAMKGGRPPAIPVSHAGEVLDYVAKLIRVGCSLEIAIQRASDRFGASVRTIQRLWTKRESISDEEPVIEITMDEALKYLASGAQEAHETLSVESVGP
jgi:hypothetical protein